jgi:putative transposase
VAAGLVSRAEDWPWSSARAHLAGEDDELATVAPLRALIPDFAALLRGPADPATTSRIERAPTMGRPLGAPEWIAALERRLGRPLGAPEWIVMLERQLGPLSGTRQTRPQAARRAGQRTANAAAVKLRVNCHRDVPGADRFSH